MNTEKCGYCQKAKPKYQMKQGWTNCYYCSEQCERIHVKQVHDSMPGGRAANLPRHVAAQIASRWSEEGGYNHG